MTTARELITDAWYLSGIVSRDLQSVSGSQISDGLRMLNALLSQLSRNSKYLSYITHTTEPLVTGVAEYEIPGLMELNELTFSLDNVNYQMIRESEYRFWGSSKITDIVSFPWRYYFEPILNGGKIYLYFSPESGISELQINGRFKLTSVTLITDLDDFMEDFYKEYLQYYLAKKICNWYDFEFSAQKNSELRRLDKLASQTSGRDYSMRILNMFQNGAGINYADVNLSNGWRPG